MKKVNAPSATAFFASTSAGVHRALGHAAACEYVLGSGFVFSFLCRNLHRPHYRMVRKPTKFTKEDATEVDPLDEYPRRDGLKARAKVTSDFAPTLISCLEL
jgi:hypothetical protein